MKKMFLFLATVGLFSCTSKSQTEKVVQAAIKADYGINKVEASAFFLDSGYKKLDLSKEQIIEQLGDAEMLKIWLSDGVERTSALSFSSTLGKTPASMIAFFDQDQLFAQFIPAVQLTNNEYEEILNNIETVLGSGETQNSELSLASTWMLDDDRTFLSIFYDLESNEFLLLSLNENIQAKNDLILFNDLEASDGWFLSSFLGDSYAQVVENKQNLYRMPNDHSSVVYAAKFEGNTILYHYLFDEDQAVSTIIFQNIETQELSLANVFTQHFNQQAVRNTRQLNENFTQTTYEWNLGNDSGALIVLLEQTLGEQVFPQSYAFISKDFMSIKNELQV